MLASSVLDRRSPCPPTFRIADGVTSKSITPYLDAFCVDKETHVVLGLIDIIYGMLIVKSNNQFTDLALSLLNHPHSAMFYGTNTTLPSFSTFLSH